MPKLTRKENSIGSSIELTNSQLSYRPGDVVSGLVKKVHIGEAAEQVTCSIRFIGRIATLVSESKSDPNGKSSTHYYEGKKLLFDFGQPVYNASVTPGINTWPFSFVIPSQPELPPPTYITANEHIPYATRSWLYIEYFLQAEVTPLSSPGHPVVALFPVYIRHATPPQPISSFAPQQLAFDDSVRTLHLDPELADKHLSLKQHIQTLFHPLSIPQFDFSLVAEYPTLIQLNHQRPISFTIRAVPRQGVGSADSGPRVEKPPVLRLIKAELALQSSTHSADLDGRVPLVRRPTDSTWRDSGIFKCAPANPLEIPMDAGGALDIGAALLQLRLSTRGASLAGQPLTLTERPMWPSFHSHYVSIAHMLRWRIVITCAGKTRTVKGSGPVTLLGPSENWELGAAARVGGEGVTRAHGQWCKGLEVANAMAIAGGPSAWAAGEPVAQPPPYEAPSNAQIPGLPSNNLGN